MPPILRTYIAGLVISSAAALAFASFAFGIGQGIGLEVDGLPGKADADILAGLAFWTAITFVSSALPVRMPRGILIAVSIAPIIAATSLGGPAAGGWVALIGTTELRELRGRIPWYGTLANHAGIALPAIACGIAIALMPTANSGIGGSLAATLVGASFFIALNIALASGLMAVRTGAAYRELLVADLGGFAVSLAGLAPLGWLMAQVYVIPGAGWWMTLLFGLAQFTTRLAYQRFVEMRELFAQTDVL